MDTRYMDTWNDVFKKRLEIMRIHKIMVLKYGLGIIWIHKIMDMKLWVKLYGKIALWF